MKRVIAILKGKLEEAKLENKVKRITSSINNTKLNAETELLELDSKMDEITDKLSEKDVNINDIICQYQTVINRRKEIKDGLDTISEIEKYLNEEVTVK